MRVSPFCHRVRVFTREAVSPSSSCYVSLVTPIHVACTWRVAAEHTIFRGRVRAGGGCRGSGWRRAHLERRRRVLWKLRERLEPRRHVRVVVHVNRGGALVGHLCSTTVKQLGLSVGTSERIVSEQAMAANTSDAKDASKGQPATIMYVECGGWLDARGGDNGKCRSVKCGHLA
jgi:hypothetical protein